MEFNIMDLSIKEIVDYAIVFICVIMLFIGVRELYRSNKFDKEMKNRYDNRR